jgi:cytidylate kinase
MSGQSEGAACAKVVAIDGPQGTGKTLVTDRIIRTAGAYFRYLNFNELSLLH